MNNKTCAMTDIVACNNLFSSPHHQSTVASREKNTSIGTKQFHKSQNPCSEEKQLLGWNIFARVTKHLHRSYSC